MAKFIWITFLVAASVCAANAGRISGGNASTIYEHTPVVQVESRGFLGWSQICAGVILTTGTIMSAAQCNDGLLAISSNRRIRAGASERGRGGITHTVDRMLNHPSYGNQGYDGNLNLIFLDKRLVYGPAIQPASIPPHGFILPENMPVKLVGWGLTSSNEGSASDVIRDVETYTMNESLCSQLYSSFSRPEVITYNMICVGSHIVGGKGACKGDWGGPILYQNVTVAIQAFGDTCIEPRMPTVGTRVSSYTNWIVNNAI